MEEVLREGTWKCPGCGNKNRGREIKCTAGCGQTREGVEFEFEDDAPEVIDAEGVAIAEAGPDWICGFCSTSNRSGTPKCKQCGGAKGEGKQREVVIETPQDSDAPTHVAAFEGPGSIGPLLKWGSAAIVSLFVLVLFLAFRTHEEKLTVASARWSRTIAIEKLLPVQETAWEGEIPTGARIQGSSSEIHHHDRVPDGTETYTEHYTVKVQSGTRRVKVRTEKLGNGFKKDIYEDRPEYRNESRTRLATRTRYRSVPVWRRKYRYEIDRWKQVRSVDTSANDAVMKWGDVVLTAGEREGPRTEDWHVTFQGNGKTYDWKPPLSDFAKLAVGSAHKIEVNGLGSIEKLLP